LPGYQESAACADCKVSGVISKNAKSKDIAYFFIYLLYKKCSS
jgi:hypothetical protein